MDPNRLFGAPRDSGALVYAVERGIVVLLEIHRGTKGRYSYFAALGMFVVET
jgi:hypothetical protein